MKFLIVLMLLTAGSQRKQITETDIQEGLDKAVTAYCVPDDLKDKKVESLSEPQKAEMTRCANDYAAGYRAGMLWVAKTLGADFTK